MDLFGVWMWCRTYRSFWKTEGRGGEGGTGLGCNDIMMMMMCKKSRHTDPHTHVLTRLVIFLLPPSFFLLYTQSAFQR